MSRVHNPLSRSKSQTISHRCVCVALKYAASMFRRIDTYLWLHRRCFGSDLHMHTPHQLLLSYSYIGDATPASIPSETVTPFPSRHPFPYPAQVFPEEPPKISLLHGSRHGVPPGSAIRVPAVRVGQLAVDLPLVERKWVHVVGAVRYR